MERLVNCFLDRPAVIQREARVLGRLPRLEPLTPDTLRAAMLAGFDLAAFDEVLR